MIGRRACIILLGSAAAAPLLWSRRAHAQQRLVGVLIPISSAAAARNIGAFRAGLRDLGHSESRDIKFELRFADGVTERLGGLASELVALKPAVIVAGGPQAAVAVRTATPTIPIVMNSSENPIALGLAVSLARPGGNVTGFWWGDEGLIGKQLELLKEVVPGIARVGIMVDPSDSNSTEPLKSLPDVSRALGLAISVIEARTPADFEPAFARAARDNLQGLHVGITPLFINDRARLAALAANARLPVVYGMREFAEAGWADILRNEPAWSLSGQGAAGRQDPEWGELGRSSHRAADQARAGGQPQGRQGARADNSRIVSHSRRRGDRAIEHVPAKPALGLDLA
ncbi:MAG: hypothetical protein C5B56_09165 [Proteobacteria bacterium]|nr:MAG: hypothetical protein C5B56_09165 [Pseudomonadota bacterium]